MSTAPIEDDAETIDSSPLTDEERYYLEEARKEPVESIKRIEEVAKFLVGATTTTSGLFLAAVKISMGDKAVPGILWVLPYVFWAISIVCLVCVLIPQEYVTGHNEPESWKKAFLEARKRKFRRLMTGAVLFILGLLFGVLSLARF